MEEGYEDVPSAEAVALEQQVQRRGRVVEAAPEADRVHVFQEGRRDAPVRQRFDDLRERGVVLGDAPEHDELALDGGRDPRPVRALR